MKTQDYDSLYKMVVEKIEQDIITSNYVVGQKYRSLRGLERKYKVSLITIKKAVEELCSKGILQSKERQGLFVVKIPQPQPLHIHYLIRRDTESFQISPFHAEIIAGARQKLQENNYLDSNFHLTPYNANAPNILQELRAIIPKQKNSLAIVSGRLSNDVPQALQKLNIPFVMVGNYNCNEGLKLINSDTFNGIQMIIDHLYKQGHTHMLYLNRKLPDNVCNINQRINGVLLTQAKNKDLDIHIEEIPQMRFEDGLAATQNLLPIIKAKKITAIIAFNDDLAVGITHALLENDYNVPNDISVTGYDDFPIASQIYPPLTTVKVNRFKMGKSAIQTLLDFVNGREITSHSETMKGTLIIRKSTSKTPN